VFGDPLPLKCGGEEEKELQFKPKYLPLVNQISGRKNALRDRFTRGRGKS